MVWNDFVEYKSVTLRRYNPLKTIHDVLSIGIHAKSDEECMTYAESIRKALNFLVKGVFQAIIKKKEYIESMEKVKKKLSKYKEE